MSINIAAIVGLSFWYLAQPQPVLVQGEAAAILHVGVAWPREVIPAALKSFSFIFPSTSAIDV
ncbi:hypothetical protein RLW55_03330 [Hyphomicrobium sp. B1]|uniref:hypothetical protein n=1 Tax=Hyphomicrobium sp. B1 TaxID=3075651 RepID=UPI003C2B8622